MTKINPTLDDVFSKVRTEQRCWCRKELLDAMDG